MSMEQVHQTIELLGTRIAEMQRAREVLERLVAEGQESPVPRPSPRRRVPGSTAEDMGQRILDLMGRAKEPLSASDIAGALGLEQRAVSRWLCKDGRDKVEHIGMGRVCRWHLVGREFEDKAVGED